MFINKRKTKSLIVHGKRIPAKLDDVTPLRLNVKIDDSVIDQVSSYKTLGVVIDSQMNYESLFFAIVNDLKQVLIISYVDHF